MTVDGENKNKKIKNRFKMNRFSCLLVNSLISYIFFMWNMVTR